MRLQKAEQLLDHLHETLDAGSMLAQREVAGQRAKVLGIRAELTEIEMCWLTSGTDRWRELRESRDALLRAVKEAEHAARNASKQETDDLVRQLMQEREHRGEARKRFEALQ